TRAAEAISRQAPDNSLSDKIGALEERIVSMLREMPQDDGAPRIDGMQAGINEVNERLKRLESSLMQRAAESAREAAPSSEIAAIITEEEVPAYVPPAPRDLMPRSPAEDAPLNAPPFPDPEPEIRPLARKRHPG